MTLSELTKYLQQAVARVGEDAEVVLYDRTTERELRVNPDADKFDFEITFGDRELVVEFDS